MSSMRILIVDDDTNICQLLGLYLRKEGYYVDFANNGQEALVKIKENQYDIVLLDVMMPIMDGLEALRELRTFSKIPVILLSAKGESMDKITGLDFGADDYITKPFEPQELISRIKAILRRAMGNNADETEITVENLSISLANYSVKIDGYRVEMPPKEIELLFFLAKNPKKVFTREQLLEQVWASEYKGDSRTVDVHIKRIREKIMDCPALRLTTVWGVGYKFEVV